MIGVGVVGYGYWGPNLVRNLHAHPQVRLVSVCDLDPARLELVRWAYPTVRATTRFEEMLAEPAIQAVVICTRVESHAELALAALCSGRHVLVEKPLAPSVAEASRLLDEARRRDLLLMVDHTFVFSPAVRKIRDLLQGGGLGSRVHYYDSVRVNLGPFRHDVNALWDLAVHDLSILDYVFPHQPLEVSCIGVSHMEGHPENLAYLTCWYPDNLLAHIHVNWLAPVKLRRTLIGGDQKMLVFDDLEPSEKLKVYDKGITVTSNGSGRDAWMVDYRSGDMWAPKLSNREALALEVDEFVDAIARGTSFPADGEAGLRVVRVLEAASRSMRGRGLPVALDAGPLSRVGPTSPRL
ncbi:MAG: Gfo/Idh/MocA family protein [Candidatus Xenobium sp.]|nr:Gfo/Idh/MocA family oxidoreductase [Burkholderiales bacterium]